ncbi:glucose 1-dehydrogenase [Nakamurella sp. YIM 132087]|uniref:Glucose 1-dehydrogenase n=1 Tax=Nakamurella alba TaxID=2665158 RepID=A0A7K1FLX2_9ACTN|nr:SDR family NAD(P)-dependent oxidoreductase [Nakamurella alba]MTD15108.1 glucose 1-dehydrogenase [Nakamurella alba]
MPPSQPAEAAFVTGGASGLGRAICERLAARGDLVVVADRDLAGAESTAAAIVAAGGSAEAVALDVSDADAVDRVVRAADAAHPLATVVNCAGIGRYTSVLDDDLSSFDLTFAINVRGSYQVLRTAAALMVPRGAGNVVNIASTSSFTASSSPMIAYDMSKAAVKMMTQAVARELGPTGIRVNGVAPGTMDTPLMRALTNDDGLDGLADSRIPLGRLGSTEEVAHAVAFLSSPEASYITGHVLVVDGGWLT